MEEGVDDGRINPVGGNILADRHAVLLAERVAQVEGPSYDVINQNADDKQCRAHHRRCINGAPGLKIPEEVIRAKCAKYRRRGKAFDLAARINDADYSIVMHPGGIPWIRPVLLPRL
jgi:hypothetical protein